MIRIHGQEKREFSGDGSVEGGADTPNKEPELTGIPLDLGPDGGVSQ